MALALIGDRRAWPGLLAAAARPELSHRAEVIRQLNRQLDPELWEHVSRRKVRGLTWRSVAATAESFSRESGVPVRVLYQPGTEPRVPETLDGDGYPRATTTSAEGLRSSTGSTA